MAIRTSLGKLTFFGLLGTALLAATVAGCGDDDAVAPGEQGGAAGADGGDPDAKAGAGGTAGTAGKGGAAGAAGKAGAGGTAGTGGTAGKGGSAGAAGTGGAAGEAQGGAAGEAGEGGAAGGGGECTVATDCADPQNECIERTCTNGVCGQQNVPANIKIAAQIAGDCYSDVCDGNASVTTIMDNSDVPVNVNPCLIGVCAAGEPSFTNAAQGTVCGNSQVCDGAGKCIGCTSATDCPGQDDECMSRTCVSSTCGLTFTLAGTVLTQQTEGDCKTAQCDGSGGIAQTADNTDVPAATSECSTPGCDNGSPSYTNAALGQPCTQGGTLCDGNGACVVCLTPADCGTDTQCTQYTCMSNQCATVHSPVGTPLAQQIPGDCSVAQCDGQGGVQQVADDTDLPSSADPCSQKSCSNGEVVSVVQPEGTACDFGGGNVCNAEGACSPTFVVARVGMGGATLNANGTPVYLEHRYFTGALAKLGAADHIVPMPIATSGQNYPLTISGTATIEGGLSRSANGQYAIFAGYAALPGAAVGNAERVIARVNAADVVDTTTHLPSGVHAAIYGASSNDGSAFWTVGEGNNTTGGVFHALLGGTTATHVLVTPNDGRSLHVFGGQVYGTSAMGGWHLLFRVGTGLPTALGQTATALPGMADNATGGSPYSFAFLDRDATPGVDTLYVADDTGAGNITKWTLGATTWSKVATFATASTKVRGLAAAITGSNVTIIASGPDSGAASTYRLIRIVDDGGATPAATSIATAAANTAYRGVALAPR